MPCKQLVDADNNVVGYICSATVEDMQVLPWECVHCSARLMLVRFEGYYGCRSTCLSCGDEFFDGEMAQRPRPGDSDCTRDWRDKRVQAALAEWAAWFDAKNPPYEETDEDPVISISLDGGEAGEE